MKKYLTSDIAAIVLMAISCFLVYFHTLDVPWYYDDVPGIVENGKIRDLNISFSNVLSSRGLVNLSFALNYSFHGLNVAGFHVFNIILHFFTSIFVFLVLKRVFPRNKILAFFRLLSLL